MSPENVDIELEQRLDREPEVSVFLYLVVELKQRRYLFIRLHNQVVYNTVNVSEGEVELVSAKLSHDFESFVHIATHSTGRVLE